LLFQRLCCNSFSMCKSLSSSFFKSPFKERDNEVTVGEREIDLFTTQRRTVVFVEPKVTSLYECSIRCTICRSLVLFFLTSNQFELQRSLIRINILLAEIFRTSSPWNLEKFTRPSVFSDAGTWPSA